MADNAIVKSDTEAIELAVAEMFPAIQDVLPASVDPVRFRTVALELARTDSYLAGCTPLSFAKSLVECAELGLVLTKHLGHAYLVPFNNKHTNQREAQLVIGYRGMIHLITQDKPSAVIYSQIVYAGEPFKITLGAGRSLIHEPSLEGRELEDYIGAYAYYSDEHKEDFEWMSRMEIEKIRASAKSKSGPWESWTEEMIKKCPIRRLAKRLEMDTKFKTAIIRDEYRQVLGDDAPVPAAQIRMPQRKQVAETSMVPTVTTVPASEVHSSVWEQKNESMAPTPEHQPVAEAVDYSTDRAPICPVCNAAMIFRRGGYAKGTGKPYPAFWSCSFNQNPAHKVPDYKNIVASLWHEQITGT